MLQEGGGVQAQMPTATNDKARVHPASLKSNPWPSMTENHCSRHSQIDTYPKSVMQGSLLRAATNGPGFSSPCSHMVRKKAGHCAKHSALNREWRTPSQKRRR